VATDLLTETGSAFVQIGDRTLHLVRALMDDIFGNDNFAALFQFKRTTGERAE
jgi:adenine-specific DNA-methyltransferase